MKRSSSQTGWRLACALFLIGALTRCADSTGTGTRDEFFNTPVVGMNAGEFGFAVRARNWNYDQSFTPDLADGTLQVGLVIAGYAGGTGQLSVTDAHGVAVFSQSLAGNLAAGNNSVIHGTPPFQVRVATTGYTGSISLGINAPTL